MSEEACLDLWDIREVTAFAAENAADVLTIFEKTDPSDLRPRDAITAAWAFARGGLRVKALRDVSWAALRAAQESKDEAANQAARAAMAAAAASYLHPLPRSTQIKHILGAAAHAARATELVANENHSAGAKFIEGVARRATPRLVDILSRYPPAPSKDGRVGELIRALDLQLRGPNT
ncbi:putative immunity protein [Roseinatronobacter alkalisoli]|uniref:Imm-5-like domain-containing protein n=1 Tax=Roseinatronobacter alkalisoli TaxID=3028235 RepID=A0ABT5T663_9RHOB|nr:hypothetical protein [Roseinatronobacter sp. HJB301]MDD7970205.1 hypothetical protein [Roseinatronobacter sp. HJB301]